MGRVSSTTIENINNFFDWWFSKHPETEGKCTLCNETLTHIVKQAEVQATAATATVTKELAKRVNQGAAPQDQVSGEALYQRVRDKSGEKTRSPKVSNGQNNPDPKVYQEPFLDTAKSIRKSRSEEKKEENEALKKVFVEAPLGKFDVVVVDPPWVVKKIDRDVRPNQSAELDYPTMSVDDIALLQIPHADNCHLFVWTTNKYLPDTFKIVDGWGAKYVNTMVWHKPGGFQPVGLQQYNCEFVVYARFGSPKFVDTKAFPLCFEAPRGGHSEKPSVFYETIARVTGGKRLDMFNRRKIAGFEGWGNESVAE